MRVEGAAPPKPPGSGDVGEPSSRRALSPGPPPTVLADEAPEPEAGREEDEDDSAAAA